MWQNNARNLIPYLTAQQNDAMSFLDRFASGSTDNSVRYSNHTYDMLMGVAEKSDNMAARTAFLHDAEAMLLESAPISPVLFGAAAHALRQYNSLPTSYHDAYRQIILFPIELMSNLHQMYFAL